MIKNTINEDTIFEINPDYDVTLQKFGPLKQSVVVVDNFYKNPLIDHWQAHRQRSITALAFLPR